LKGHDFSRAAKRFDINAALQAAKNLIKASRLKGTGFSPYIMASKIRGLSAPEGMQSCHSQRVLEFFRCQFSR
jgi:hypothetical protein